MRETLLNWKIDGQLKVPVFDKSLRNGLGDRSHWREEHPDLLILEGWFLGVKPVSNDFEDDPLITPSLTSHESSYRLNIQKNLNEYLDIWNLIDNIWQLKPIKFEYMNIWKSKQENDMFRKKGTALKDKQLDNFLRMLNVSIPNKCFEQINPDTLLIINQERKLIEVGLN